MHCFKSSTIFFQKPFPKLGNKMTILKLLLTNFEIDLNKI